MDDKTPKKGRTKGKTTQSEAPSFGPMTQKGTLIKCPHCRTDNLSDSRFCSNCANPLKEPESSSRTVKSQTFEISRGDLFAARYEIIESLGQGGMGKVFKAYDRKINEVVAVKLIRPEISVNDKAIERFKNELKIARKITHRNICRMHDLGEEGFFHYITMEYVAGEDLKRFIRRAGTLSSGKAINIAKQVCEGLAEAHRLGVIHRDLKPQNIMIDQDGNAKIMDFGIARFVDTDRLTGSGVMIGTPEYMSPEQAELLDVDKRADIYSLGVVLYEMVSGQVPFDGETPLSIAMKHKTEKPRNVRELNAYVPVGLAGIISKCLEKAPDNRYQGAEEVVAELNRIEQDLSTGERVVQKKESPLVKENKRQGPAFQMRKVLVPAAAVVLLGLTAFVVIKLIPKKESVTTPYQRAEVPAKKKDSGQETIQSSDSRKVTAETRKSDADVAGARAKDSKISERAATVPPTKKDEPTTAPDAKKGVMGADETAANASLARMNAVRSYLLNQGLDAKTLFFRLAEAKGQEGQKYFSQNNFREARGALAVSEKLYRLCMEKNKDEDRLKALKNYVEDLRGSIESRQKASARDKSFAAAWENEKQGAAALAKKQAESAAKSYIQAAAVYEKIFYFLKTAKK